MKLRSSSKRLKEWLKSCGAYEDGMKLEEMKQVAQAMHMSAVSTTAMESLDRHESELDNRESSNSTMIADSPVESLNECRSFDCNCDSPPTNPIRMVHHELNWSPLKRRGSDIDASDVLSSKRQKLNVADHLADATPISISSSDSEACDEDD